MKKYIWGLWVFTTMLFACWWVYQIFYSEDKSTLLIGEGSHGHHQIELSCKSCHTNSFSNQSDIQQACVGCHGKELKEVDDSHPKSKFTDPRNVGRTQHLDARYCVSCHAEHQSEYTQEMGLTLPADFCFYCHQDVGEERTSHLNLEFDSCASAGCHNYHDNRALYEDFLLRHSKEDNILKPALLIGMDAFKSEVIEALDKPALTREDVQWAPEILQGYPEKTREEIVSKWLSSAHARAGVNCEECHQQESKTDGGWVPRPGHLVCASCHGSQTEGFYAGKHGMRVSPYLAVPQSPLKPSMSKLAFKESSLEIEHGCNTCHGAHGYDLQEVAVESCLRCHDDQHTNNYKRSKHFQLWQKEVAGILEEGSGVSCASCHMPRILSLEKGKQAIEVEHNQNRFYQPNEKMARPVCMHCHGLSFVLDALADESLIENNFQGVPKGHIPSIDWAVKREKINGEKDE